MTQMTRYTPSRTLGDLQREVDDIFDRFFGRGRDEEPTSAVWSPRTDLSETDSSYEIRLDLPGMTKDDIVINLQNRTLTVRGERTSDRTREDEEFVRVERAFGTFHRSFTLPEAVDAENIEATYDNGVLTVTVPKTEESMRRQIDIQ